MPEYPCYDPADDGRTEEERELDRGLKATFPASDPPSHGGTATPSDTPPPEGEDKDEEGGG